MRELGVTSAFGVTLGPPPTRLEKLQAVSNQEPTPEIEQELARAAEEAWDEQTRMFLAATGKNYSVDELRAMRPLPPGIGA